MASPETIDCADQKVLAFEQQLRKLVMSCRPDEIAARCARDDRAMVQTTGRAGVLPAHLAARLVAASCAYYAPNRFVPLTDARYRQICQALMSFPEPEEFSILENRSDSSAFALYLYRTQISFQSGFSHADLARQNYLFCADDVPSRLRSVVTEQLAVDPLVWCRIALAIASPLIVDGKLIWLRREFLEQCRKYECEPGQLEKVIESLAQSADDLGGRYLRSRAKESGVPPRLWCHLESPLRRRPIVRTNAGDIVPSLHMFRDAISHEIWRGIISTVRQTDPRAQEQFGKRFCQYVKKISEKLLVGSVVRVLDQERAYTGVQKCDLVIEFAGETLLVECKSVAGRRELATREAVAGDGSVRQIRRAIDQIGATARGSKGWPQGRYLGLVVTFEPVGVGVDLRDPKRRPIGLTEVELDLNEISDRVQVASIRDLELILCHLRVFGGTFGDLWRRSSQSTGLRLGGWRYLLRERMHELQAREDVNDIWRELAADIWGGLRTAE